MLKTTLLEQLMLQVYYEYIDIEVYLIKLFGFYSNFHVAVARSTMQKLRNPLNNNHYENFNHPANGMLCHYAKLPNHYIRRLHL